MVTDDSGIYEMSSKPPEQRSKPVSVTLDLKSIAIIAGLIATVLGGLELRFTTRSEHEDDLDHVRATHSQDKADVDRTLAIYNEKGYGILKELERSKDDVLKLEEKLDVQSDALRVIHTNQQIQMNELGTRRAAPLPKSMRKP